MIRVLITGKDSYIGTSLENWLMREPDKYLVNTVDVIDGSWHEKDFSTYDVAIHVAGIVHIKETGDNQDLYFKVNRDLAYEIARKTKADGVQQFCFLSSMSVYGIENGFIDKRTPLRPSSAYGKSKLEAEELIKKLIDESFTVSTIRPPMVYGMGCRGNYPRLVELALKTPIFPMVENERSMIYIDNLSEFIKQIIDNRSGGMFFPQNAEYVNTSEMVRLIAKAHGKKLKMTKLFNPLIKLLNLRTLNKVFGDLAYDKRMSEYITKYSIIDLNNSIVKTEV